MTPSRLALAILLVLAASCGSSSKSASMSFQVFKEKLQGMKTPFEEPCPDCRHRGTIVDPESGSEVPCPTCGGTGVRKGVRGPTVAEFEAVFGKPRRVESKPAELVWEHWLFPCREGTVRLPVFLEEEPGDEIRVATGEPELIPR